MGWWANWREKRAAQRRQQALLAQQRAQQAALEAWQREGDELRRLIQMSQWPGDTTGNGLVLKRGEALLFTYHNASLIESRRSRGHYEGGYSGFSFRIAKGVSYHVGGTRGTYVQGPEAPTVIDQGDVYITDERVVFLGSRQNREWAYAKLLGVRHDDDAPRTFLPVSNRQKTSGFDYSPEHATVIHFALALGLARFHDQSAQLTASLQQELQEHEAAKPPAVQAPALPATTVPPSPPPSR